MLCAIVFFVSRRKAFDPGWDRGQLKQSEIAYYLTRMGRIGRYWRRTAVKAGHNKDGRIEEPYPTLLVVDTLKPAMWLETAGEVDPNNYTELPKNMRWKLYRISEDGNTDLEPVVRLKLRGFWTKQIFPEMICVHGYGRGKGHLSFYVTESQTSVDYGGGAIPTQNYTGQREENVDYYDSIMVDEQEYNKIINSAKDLDKEIAQLKRSINSEQPRNLANWLKAEKQLHVEIERQASGKGLDVSRLRLVAGPDYTAGHVKLRVDEDSLLKDVFRPSLDWALYLKIDYVGKDIWYLRNAVNPDLHRTPRFNNETPPQLEFLVICSGDITDAQTKKLMEKGRQLQDMQIGPKASYSVTLSNGATAEFFGICSNPSAGKQWWGPDGSLLEHSPYYNAEKYGSGRSDRRIYEMVWRISGANRTQSSMEGAQGSYYHQKQDRYGNDIRYWHPEAYGFEKDRKTTTWRIGMGSSSEDMQRVEFRNISLVPGQDFGFEIVRIDEASE
jgi:hypothetical protein